MQGARAGMMSGLRRLIASAMARDLCAFVVPGPDVARARGLDFAGAGLHIAATPRHANVLLIIGALPPNLLDAATITYAQMPRPRAIVALGTGALGPLSTTDAVGPLTQAGLVGALAELRRVMAAGAFAAEVTDFEAPVIQTRIEYTCPMHPEVISDAPGNCPKCGMTLVPKETYAGGHSGHAMPTKEPAATTAVSHDHSSRHAEAAAQYTCPMHPEVVSDEPGNCPKCGMTLMLAKAEPDDHSGHAGGPVIDGIEPQFMSMVDLTRDMPASADGLKMEWITVPFGPFFPGLPGGMDLTLTLDGDAIAEMRVPNLVASPVAIEGMKPAEFVDHVAQLDALSALAGRQLACLALENAAGIAPDVRTAMARAAAVERERIASHLGWLASFSVQIGLVWMERCAAAKQLSVQAASADEITAQGRSLRAFLHRVRKTPLLGAKLAGNGRIGEGKPLVGPVARAQGIASDARAADPVYDALGFRIVTRTGGDALARLYQRCDEIDQSLDLIARAKELSVPEQLDIGTASGKGEAIVETPRGTAQLTVELRDGKLAAATYLPPSAAHMDLLRDLIETQEIADALVAVGSLDLSPWGLPA